MPEIDLVLVADRLTFIRDGIPDREQTSWAREQLGSLITELEEADLTEYTVYRDVEEYINVRARDDDHAEQVADEHPIDEWTRTIKDRHIEAE